MQTVDERDDLTTEQALDKWRIAERTAAVARRGRVAAEAAVAAAADAAEAANETAVAAKAALESASVAEASARKVAVAARAIVEAVTGDAADAETDVAMSDIAEVEAHEQYRQAAARAAATRGT